MQRLASFMIGVTLLSTLSAAPPGVLHWRLDMGLETTYSYVYNSLEENRFFIVFEPNIQANLGGFAKRWGADYNRNELQGIRAMVFCNAWYANPVSNVDPQLLALCPLHLTLYQKAGATEISFLRPTHAAQGSKAIEIAAELEADVKKAVEQGIAAALEDKQAPTN